MATEVVRCRFVSGVLREITVEDLNEFLSPGSVLEQRLVRVNGRTFVRKYVSKAAGSRNPRLYDLLDNEIRAGARLGQVYGDRYPSELACLAAYNIDAEEPFVLLHEYLGEPAAGLVPRFDDAARRQFEQGLFRAVQLTGAAGVAHGALSMDAVRWHGGRLQLVDFESAERVGESRRAGRGTVDARDDLWAAALLVRRLHLGAAPPDRRHDPDRLRALLDPIFDNPVEAWPHAGDLLAKLRADNRMPPFTDPDAALAAGRELFEQVSRGKRAPVPVQETPPAPVGRAKWLFPFVVAVVFVTAVIIGVVLA